MGNERKQRVGKREEGGREVWGGEKTESNRHATCTCSFNR